ncbi:hypothetical protein ADUPG1_002678, partial [Aduncisulcus paluster]
RETRWNLTREVEEKTPLLACDVIRIKEIKDREAYFKKKDEERKTAEETQRKNERKMVKELRAALDAKNRIYPKTPSRKERATDARYRAVLNRKLEARKNLREGTEKVEDKIVLEGRPFFEIQYPTDPKPGRRSAPEEAETLLKEGSLDNLSRVMGPDLLKGMEKMVELKDQITPEDIKKFSIVCAKETSNPVNPDDDYQKLVIALFKYMEDLFEDLDETPAAVEPFRVELVDETRCVAEQYRQIRRDWKDEIQEQLIKMEEKGVIRISQSSYHCATVIQPKKNGKLRLC